MNKCPKCRDGIAHGFRHGTTHAYFYHDCRCAQCVEGHASTRAAWRDRRPGYVRAYSASYRARNLELARAKRIDAYERNRVRENEHGRAYKAANADYLRVQNQRRNEGLKALVPNPRSGNWTQNEDLIALRSDLSNREVAVMLQRTYSAVTSRRHALRRTVRESS